MSIRRQMDAHGLRRKSGSRPVVSSQPSVFALRGRFIFIVHNTEMITVIELCSEQTESLRLALQQSRSANEQVVVSAIVQQLL